jgi:hypothetical protein
VRPDSLRVIRIRDHGLENDFIGVRVVVDDHNGASERNERSF